MTYENTISARSRFGRWTPVLFEFSLAASIRQQAFVADPAAFHFVKSTSGVKMRAVCIG